MTPQSILSWLRSIEQQSGYEILLVQTVRNALMAASVVASTSLVAIIGVVTVGRAFPSSGSGAIQYAHWAMSASGVVLAISLTEALLALRTLARAGFGSGSGSGSGAGPASDVGINQRGSAKSSGDTNEESANAEKFARHVAGALQQLSRAAVSLAIGMSVAVISGLLFAW